jgi:succinate dehydrogenase hydrophobic anchor subunit
MLKETAQFFRDIGNEMAETVRWFFSPHAWRIVLVVLLNLGILGMLGYLAISKYDYGKQPFARCYFVNKNLLFITEFFAFCFFALFALATVGEILNWVDEKKTSRGTPSIKGLLTYATLSACCGGVALLMIINCV